MKQQIQKLFWILLPGLLFLAFWEWAVFGSERLRFLFASPSMIYDVAGEELFSPSIWQNIAATAMEAVLGLFAGCIFGTAAGLFMWGNGRLEYIARPYVVLLGSIPVFALAPIFIIWFGIGLLSKVIMAAFGCFFISLIQAFEGAKSASAQYSDYAKSIGADRAAIMQKIIVPGALEWVSTGIKVNVGFALFGAFIGEFVSSERGLGHYILTASSLYDMPRVLFGVALLSLFALILTKMVEISMQALTPWHKA